MTTEIISAETEKNIKAYIDSLVEKGFSRIEFVGIYNFDEEFYKDVVGDIDQEDEDFDCEVHHISDVPEGHCYAYEIIDHYVCYFDIS